MNERLIVIVRATDANTENMEKLAEDIWEAIDFGSRNSFYPNIEAGLVKGKWRYRNLTRSEVEQYEQPLTIGAERHI